MIDESKRKIYDKIAFNLYTARIGNKLSQQELAHLSEVERSKISRIENSKEDFLFSTIIKLADALKVSINVLLDFSIVIPESFNKRKKAPKAKK